VVDSLTWMRIHRRVSIYAYCLMPDHLHPTTSLSPRFSSTMATYLEGST
jgi:REP element-mobilizing transposase RayT